MIRHLYSRLFSISSIQYQSKFKKDKIKIFYSAKRKKSRKDEERYTTFHTRYPCRHRCCTKLEKIYFLNVLCFAMKVRKRTPKMYIYKKSPSLSNNIFLRTTIYLRNSEIWIQLSYFFKNTLHIVVGVEIGSFTFCYHSLSLKLEKSLTSFDFLLLKSSHIRYQNKP